LLGTAVIAKDVVGAVVRVRGGRRELGVIAAGVSSAALTAWLAGDFLLGVGTALAYPALLAAVNDASHPSWRAAAIGVDRFWRDSGYARPDRRHHRRPREPGRSRRCRGRPHRRVRPARLGFHERDPSPSGPAGTTCLNTAGLFSGLLTGYRIGDRSSDPL